MKKTILLTTLFSFIFFAHCVAQGLSINTSGNPADPSAMLDVSSTTKGLLIPRMTTAEMLAISNPAAELIVLDISTNQLMQNTGTPAVPNWNNISFNSAWDLKGNSGTDTAVNFLGTTDNRDLKFRINNVNAGTLGVNGNSFYGSGAGVSSTTGFNNIGIGNSALYYNTDRSSLVAIGDSALFNNGLSVSASYHATSNTAIGSKSMMLNRTGFNNTAVGSNTLNIDSTSSNIVAIGAYAMSNARNGSDFSTAVGAYALAYSHGLSNSAFGYGTLYNNTTGQANIALGPESMLENTTGSFNTSMGYLSLSNNTTGNYNTALGAYSSLFNTTGQYNTSVGYNAALSNTSGAANTSVGYESDFSATNGINNTSIGERAAYFKTTGNGNVSVGESAGFNLTTGNNNVAVGTDAGEVGGNWNNTTSINNAGFLNAFHNQVFIGNTSVVYIGGQVTWSTYSDERIKKNIAENVPGLAFIKNLRPVTYNLDIHKQAQLTDNKLGENYPGKYDIETIKMTGFLAQEVAAAAKNCGYDFSGVRAPTNDKQLYTVSYEQFVVPLVKGMQEQQAMIEDLRLQNRELLQRLEKLEKNR